MSRAFFWWECSCWKWPWWDYTGRGRGVPTVVAVSFGDAGMGTVVIVRFSGLPKGVTIRAVGRARDGGGMPMEPE